VPKNTSYIELIYIGRKSLKIYKYKKTPIKIATVTKLSQGIGLYTNKDNNFKYIFLYLCYLYSNN